MATTPTLPISIASTTDNKNVIPRHNKRLIAESSFGLDFVTIFLTENGDINYVDDLNENFVQVLSPKRILEHMRKYEFNRF